jgi:hypothetical protein
MRVAQFDLLKTVNGSPAMSTNLASNCTSPAIFLGHIIDYSVQCVFTGSPVGSFYLQVSNDFGIGQNDWANAIHWTNVPSSSIAVSAAGDFVINVQNSGYNWARLVYTATSGSGTITFCQANVKGV